MRNHFSGKFPGSDQPLGSMRASGRNRLPGPLCSATMADAANRAQIRADTNALAHSLLRISASGGVHELEGRLDQLLGPNSFAAATLAGFGGKHGSIRPYDMAQIITLLVLAEVHENRHVPAFWQRLARSRVAKRGNPMSLPADVARDAQIAFDERKTLVGLVDAALGSGSPVLAAIDQEVRRQYQKLSQYFQTDAHGAAVADKHELGLCFGQLLMALLTGKDGAALIGSIAPRVPGLQPLLLRLHKKIPPAKLAGGAAAGGGPAAGKKAPTGAASSGGAAGAAGDAADAAGSDDGAPPVGKATKENCEACAKAMSGYPVDSINGCKVLLGSNELDFNLPAPLPFPWQRSYSSDNPTVGWLGQGWSLPISLALKLTRRATTLLDAQHRGITFPPLGTGEFFFSRHEQLTLKRVDLFNFQLIDRDRRHFWFCLPDPSSSQARLTRQQDANGNGIAIDYDEQNLPVRIVDACGRHFSLEFNEQKRLIRIGEVQDATAPPIALMHYDYDDAGDLVRVRNGANLVTREFAYKNHILVKHAVPDGLVSEYEYNEYFPAGRVLRNRTNTGVALQFAYAKNRTLITDALGRRTYHHFDEDRRYTGTVDALGNKQTLVRDSFGNVLAFTDQNGQTARYQFDSRSRVIKIEAVDGGVTHLGYDDGCDKPAKVIDPLGGITQYQYDKAGNLLKKTDALGRTTSYSYNPQGLLVRIIDARGGSNQFEYNESGQLIASTDCSGRTTRREYTADGDLQCLIDPLGKRIKYAHDQHGRRIATWNPDDSRERFERDDQGRVIRRTNGNGETIHFAFDAEGRVQTRTDALGGRLEYRYDAGQRLTQLVNENGAVHSFEYDLADRLVQESGFDQRITRYRYDAVGKLIAKVEIGANGTEEDMIDTLYQRDKLGRMIGKTVKKAGESTSTRFAYDAMGRMVEAANASAIVRMVYDAVGQLIGEECQLTAADGSAAAISRLRHCHDALGNRIQTILPDGRTINRLYYGSGHLHQINVDGDVVCDMERDAGHREINRTQGALQSEFAYDPMGRLVTQFASRVDAMLPAQADTNQSPPIIARDYAYDAAGNLLAIDDARFGRSRYEYDRAGRIVAATHGETVPAAAATAGAASAAAATAGAASAGAASAAAASAGETFAFDAAHNPVDHGPDQLSGTVLENNRLSRYADKFWAYDGYGNVIGKRVGQQMQMRLHWNGEHQLVRAMVKRQGVAQVTNTEYGYDPFGRRIFKRDAQGETRFVWDGNRLLAEVRNGQSTTWIYEGDSFVPMAQMHAGADTQAGAGAMEVLHIHTDHLGTPRELSDAQGRLRWAARYQAWGALLPDAVENALPEPHQPLRFQGQYFDVETGLHYNRFRYYDPDVGRFVSQDPIGLRGGENLYQYAPNPTGWVDPLGLCKKCGDDGCDCIDDDDMLSAMNQVGLVSVTGDDIVAEEADDEADELPCKRKRKPSGGGKKRSTPPKKKKKKEEEGENCKHTAKIEALNAIIDAANAAIEEAGGAKNTFATDSTFTPMNPAVLLKGMPQAQKMEITKAQARFANFSLLVKTEANSYTKKPVTPEIQTAAVSDGRILVSGNTENSNNKIRPEEDTTVEAFYIDKLRPINVRNREAVIKQVAKGMTKKKADQQALLKIIRKVQADSEKAGKPLAPEDLTKAVARELSAKGLRHPLRVRSTSARGFVKEHGDKILHVPPNKTNIHAEAAIAKALEEQEGVIEAIGGTKVACLACRAYFKHQGLEDLLGKYAGYVWISAASQTQLGEITEVGNLTQLLVEIKNLLSEDIEDLEFYTGKGGEFKPEDMEHESDIEGYDSEDEEAIRNVVGSDEVKALMKKLFSGKK
jgi:RHS repeat-associated protein